MIESRESARGCGYRKVGGLYLVFDGPGAACGKMPIPLCVCPTCGAGIKAARGWTWIDGDALTAEAKAKKCALARRGKCRGCPMDSGVAFGRSGLIWIGEQFYKTPGDFQDEARRMGISRRISAVPRGFEVGKTFVFLAHREACPPKPFDPPLDLRAIGDGELSAADRKGTPGIFSIFVPSRIEVICDGKESAEQIAEYEARGLTPVKVIRLGEDRNLFDESN